MAREGEARRDGLFGWCLWPGVVEFLVGICHIDFELRVERVDVSLAVPDAVEFALVTQFLSYPKTIQGKEGVRSSLVSSNCLDG